VDPLYKPTELNYDHYIVSEDWSPAQHVRNSPLLLMVDRLVPWIPSPLHQESLRAIMAKYNSSDGGYYSGRERPSKRLSRTNHAQVAAIIARHMAAIQERANKEMKEDRLEQFQKELSEGLSIANLIEAECERRAEERRRKVHDGNITWVTIPAEKGTK
jgi:hypothetical protein